MSKQRPTGYINQTLAASDKNVCGRSHVI